MILNQLLENNQRELAHRRQLLVLQSEFIDADKHARDVELVRANIDGLGNCLALSTVTIDGNIKILAGVEDSHPSSYAVEFDCRPLGINCVKRQLLTEDHLKKNNSGITTVGDVLAGFELAIWIHPLQKTFEVNTRMELVKALAAYKYDADVHEAKRRGELFRLMRKDPDLKDMVIAEMQLILKSHIGSLFITDLIS